MKQILSSDWLPERLIFRFRDFPCWSHKWKFSIWPQNEYFTLLTELAEYWPRSFLCFYWPRRSQYWPILVCAILTSCLANNAHNPCRVSHRTLHCDRTWCPDKVNHNIMRLSLRLTTIFFRQNGYLGLISTVAEKLRDSGDQPLAEPMYVRSWKKKFAQKTINSITLFFFIFVPLWLLIRLIIRLINHFLALSHIRDTSVWFYVFIENHYKNTTVLTKQ